MHPHACSNGGKTTPDRNPKTLLVDRNPESCWLWVQVKADKLREVKDGHDGTWVAHPALVTLAKEIFDEHMPQPNQIDKKREDVKTTRESLLEVSAPHEPWSCIHWTSPNLFGTSGDGAVYAPNRTGP